MKNEDLIFIQHYLFTGLVLAFLYIMVFFIACTEHVKRYPNLGNKKAVLYFLFGAFLIMCAWPILAIQAWAAMAWKHIDGYYKNNKVKK